jgi:hypothetical protein
MGDLAPAQMNAIAKYLQDLHDAQEQAARG